MIVSCYKLDARNKIWVDKRRIWMKISADFETVNYKWVSPSPYSLWCYSNSYVKIYTYVGAAEVCTFLIFSDIDVQSQFRYLIFYFVSQTVRYKKMKILSRCVKWLRFSGIMTTTEIGIVTSWDPKVKQPNDYATLNGRLFRLPILTLACTVPQVVTIKFFFYDL